MISTFFYELGYHLRSLNLFTLRKVKLIIVIIALLIVSGGVYYMFGNYGSGYRAGTMIKFSQKGYVFKTYEGELNLGMVLQEHQPSVATNNIWKFSVRASNKEVIRKLEDAVLAGKRVKVSYNEKFVKLPWRGDTKYIVDEVETQP